VKAWENSLNGRARVSRKWKESSTDCLILLLIGGGVEWLFWTYAYAPLCALQATAQTGNSTAQGQVSHSKPSWGNGFPLR